MRIVIDKVRCTGHARCASIAPDLFVLNDDGYIDTDGFEVPPGQEALAARGARACPERIMTIVKDNE